MSAVFILQTDSTLTTASGSTVSLVGGAQECNVFWQVGSSATLKTDSVFVGTVMAHTTITAQTRATVAGRLLAGAAANGAGLSVECYHRATSIAQQFNRIRIEIAISRQV